MAVEIAMMPRNCSRRFLAWRRRRRATASSDVQSIGGG